MKQIATLLAGATFVLSTGTSAQPTVDSGYDVYSCELAVLRLDEGHQVLVWKGKGIELTEADKPQHLSHVECVNMMEIMPDKSFKSSGYCTHADRDGDKWINRSWQDSTMKKARWETKGTSGKYIGLSQTGSYTYTDMSNESGCKGVSRWEVDR